MDFNQSQIPLIVTRSLVRSAWIINPVCGNRSIWTEFDYVCEVCRKITNSETNMCRFQDRNT